MVLDRYKLVVDFNASRQAFSYRGMANHLTSENLSSLLGITVMLRSLLQRCPSVAPILPPTASWGFRDSSVDGLWTKVRQPVDIPPEEEVCGSPTASGCDVSLMCLIVTAGPMGDYNHPRSDSHSFRISWQAFQGQSTFVQQNPTPDSCRLPRLSPCARAGDLKINKTYHGIHKGLCLEHPSLGYKRPSAHTSRGPRIQPSSPSARRRSSLE